MAALLQPELLRHSMPSMRESDCSHNSYDVVILGGGPAGAATALALKKLDSALRIALIERSDYSGIRIGETLPPPARTLLTELGVWEVFLETSPRACHGTRAAWGSERFHENEFIFSPHGYGWHLDRRAFDAMLTAEAEHRGVEVIQPAAPYNSDRQEGQWILGISGAKNLPRRHENLYGAQPPGPPTRAGVARGGVEPPSAALKDLSQTDKHDHSTEEHGHEIYARFVVDATGRRSWFASHLGMRHLVQDQLVGVFSFFRFDRGQAPDDSYTSIAACEHGWWYSAILPGEGLAVAFMTDADQLRQLRWKDFDEWQALLGMAPNIAQQIGTATPIGKPMLYPAASQRLETCAGDGWLAVGDAASTFDPLSSQGIVKGLRSGICAARSICRYLRGNSNALAEYADFVEREYSKYLDSRAGYYGLEQRWPDLPFWQRRQEQIHLDPRQLLRRLPHPANLDRIIMRLPHPQVRSLISLCATPRKAGEVVTQFHDQARRRYSDRDVVLTLQALISRNVLSTSTDPDHHSLVIHSQNNKEEIHAIYVDDQHQ